MNGKSAWKVSTAADIRGCQFAQHTSLAGRITAQKQQIKSLIIIIIITEEGCWKKQGKLIKKKKKKKKL